MAKYHIVVTRNLPGDALETLKNYTSSIKIYNDPLSQEDLRRAVHNCDAILTMLSDKMGKDAIDAAGPQLKVISNYAVGYNNIDVNYATQKSIIVTHTPDVLTNATADLTWALILATARRLIEADNLVRNELWKSWAPNFMLGTDVHHKTLGIIGLGRIGLSVAKRAQAFNQKVIYYSRTRKPELESCFNIQYRSLEDLLTESDIISIHVPLSPETEGMIDEKQFQLMKPTAILINTARGPIINESALIHALKNSRIRGAGLDVYQEEPTKNRELFKLNNVVLTPHIGSATHETRIKMADLAVTNLINALERKYDHIKIVNPSVLQKLV